MRCVISLMLMPLLLVSQGLCVAHTHHGTQTAAPEGHSLRPHFHVHRVAGHHHHHADHSHHHDDGDEQAESVAPTIEPFTDHDADAVYCPEYMAIGAGRQFKSVLTLKQLVAVSFWQSPAVPDISPVKRGNSWGQPPRPLCDARCPIYLRTLSIRI